MHVKLTITNKPILDMAKKFGWQEKLCVARRQTAVGRSTFALCVMPQAISAFGFPIFTQWQNMPLANIKSDLKAIYDELIRLQEKNDLELIELMEALEFDVRDHQIPGLLNWLIGDVGEPPQDSETRKVVEMLHLI